MVIGALVLAVGCSNKYATSGKIAMKSKNYEKAIHDFNLALETDSTNAEAHFMLAQAYKSQGDFDGMNEHFAAASRLTDKYNNDIEMVRDSVWAEFFKTGTEKAKAENFESALADFQTAIRIQPKRYEAYTNAGYVWQNLDTEDLPYEDSAFAYYQQAMNLEPENINIMEQVAQLSYGESKLEFADSMFAVILEKDPGNVDAIIRRGEIADRQERYVDAVKFYNQALQIDPALCDVWFNLGVVYFQQMKKLEDAEQAFARAADPSVCGDEDINAIVNLNVVLISNDKLDEAIARLTEFTTKHPDECVGWDLLSQALLRKGQKDEAYKAKEKFDECTKKQG
jgi:tetratricopeptide (TPR) repeat protein